MNATALPAPAHDQDAHDQGLSASDVWLGVPRVAARLLRNHWPQLVFWFFAQRVAYDLTMQAAIALAEHSVLLSYAAIAVLIVTQLVGTILMFLSLRPSMPVLTQPRSLAVPAQTWVASLSAALLPFFAYYATWGLLDGIKRDFRLKYILGVAYYNQENLGDVLALHWLWVALIITFALRILAKRLARNGKLRWNLLVAVCDAYWIFVGVAAITRGLAWLRELWHGTVAWHALVGWWHTPFVFHIDLSAIKHVVEPAWAFVATAAIAMLMPLIWLAITAIIYGLDLRRGQRIDAADRRFGALGARYGQSHFLVKELIGKISGGWASKGVPIVNAIRLVLRAGLPSLLMLCLGWELLEFVDAWGWRLCVDVIGPQDNWTWRRIGNALDMLIGSPLSLRPSLFTEMLRVVLLAACFDRAIANLPAPVSGEAIATTP